MHGFDPDDTILVRAWTSVPAERAARHEAVLVLADPARNEVVEIRQVLARPVAKEPSYTPLPPRTELVELADAFPSAGGVVRFTLDP